MEEQRCTRCKEVKLLEEFNRSRTRKNGRASQCESCQNERAKAYRDSIRDRPIFHTEPKETKRCYGCKETKPIEEFHRNSKQKDGYSTRCKECAIKNARTNYIKNRERHQEYQRAHRVTNTEYYKNYSIEYGRRYPERVRANNMIYREVAANRLPPVRTLKCDTCDKQARHYHHPDYSKPLEVIPLCESCHRRVHGALKTDANGYRE